MHSVERFDVSVHTLLHKADGTLFANLGDPMQWPGVNKQIVDWFSGSCKRTAFWLMDLPQTVGSQSYTLKYRTVVRSANTIVSDTTWIEFPRLGYADVIRFEGWALDQLEELIELFAEQHDNLSEPTEPRSSIKTALSFMWQSLRNRLALRDHPRKD